MNLQLSILFALYVVCYMYVYIDIYINEADYRLLVYISVDYAKSILETTTVVQF